MTLIMQMRGASKFEFLATVIVLAGLATFLLNRLAYYEERAEKANMEATASAIKSALRVQMSLMLIQGRSQEYALLAQQNPLDWLEQKTVKDSDLSGQAKPDRTLPGGWSFEAVSRTLIYSVSHGDYFEPDSTGQKRVRWQVQLIRDSSHSDAHAMVSDRVVGLTLVSIEPYHWF